MKSYELSTVAEELKLVGVNSFRLTCTATRAGDADGQELVSISNFDDADQQKLSRRCLITEQLNEVPEQSIEGSECCPGSATELPRGCVVRSRRILSGVGGSLPDAALLAGTLDLSGVPAPWTLPGVSLAMMAASTTSVGVV
ncbi:hypothetical protein U1Q18_034477 [Sarracenia purpurea var. burkii]